MFVCLCVRVFMGNELCHRLVIRKLGMKLYSFPLKKHLSWEKRKEKKKKKNGEAFFTTAVLWLVHLFYCNYLLNLFAARLAARRRWAAYNILLFFKGHFPNRKRKVLGSTLALNGQRPSCRGATQPLEVNEGKML